MPPQPIVRVEISVELDRWIQGFGALEAELLQRGRDSWQQAVDSLFDYSQEYVHVLSGELKASGEKRVVAEGDRLVGEVEYDTPYAIYEHARGGSHSFLQLAYLRTYERFERALPRAFEAVVQSWR